MVGSCSRTLARSFSSILLTDEVSVTEHWTPVGVRLEGQSELYSTFITLGRITYGGLLRAYALTKLFFRTIAHLSIRLLLLKKGGLDYPLCSE